MASDPSIEGATFGPLCRLGTLRSTVFAEDRRSADFAVRRSDESAV
jgi:hypothetical protein